MNIKIVWPLSESFIDYFDNESICVSIYVIGCDHNCVNCHNKDLQDFNYDINIKDINILELANNIEYTCVNSYTDKVSIMGGEPLHPKNIKGTKGLLLLLNQKKLKVTLYTGYELEYVAKNNVIGFEYLKTGKYDVFKKQESFKTEEYFQLASKNQKVFDRKHNLLSIDGKFKF